MVVITAKPPDEHLLETMLASPAATALVTVGEPLPGATIIDCQPGQISLPQLGLTCRAQVLDSERVDAVADLLDDAEDTEGEPLVFVAAEFATSTTFPMSTG